MKKIFLMVLVFVLLSSGSVALAQPDIYAQQAQQSGATELPSVLSEETTELLEYFKIDITKTDWAEQLTPETVFEVFTAIFKSNGKSIVLSCVSVIGFILLSSFLQYFSFGSVSNKTLGYVSVLGVSVMLIFPFVSVISSVTKAIQSGCVFMTSFIPVYCGILVSGGHIATSAGFSAFMLGATEFVSFVASFVVLPLVSMYLALRICFCFSPAFSMNGFANAVKKGAIWILSLILLLFLGVLKIQNVIHAATDSLSLSTAKFVVGTTVPLVGSAVGEAISTVKGCISMLGSSVGMYGVLAFACIFLPVFIQLFVWKLGVGLSVIFSDVFAHQKISEILRSVEDTLSFLIAIIACSAVFFVVAITLVSAGGRI